MDLIDKLTIAYPDAKFSSVGDEITWSKENSYSQPTEDEINAKFQASQYQRDRLQEYPNTNDLIVALWEKVVEGRSESADALEVKRQEVKTAHPKPE